MCNFWAMCLFFFFSLSLFFFLLNLNVTEIFRIESEVQDASHVGQGLVDGYVGKLQYNDKFGFSFVNHFVSFLVFHHLDTTTVPSLTIIGT